MGKQRLRAAWRLGIAKKLVGIYLLVAIPLVVIINLTYANWYSTRIDGALRRQVDSAMLVGNTFNYFIDDLSKPTGLIGERAVQDKTFSLDTSALVRLLIDDYPISHVVVTDATGTVTAATMDELVGKNLATSEAFSDVIEGGRHVSVGNVEDAQTGSGFYIAHGIAGADGSLQAIAGSFISTARLHGALPISVRDGLACILDASGRVAYHSADRKPVEESANWSTQNLIRVALSDETITALSFTLPGGEEPGVVGGVPIKGLGWVALAYVDEARTVGAIRKSTRDSMMLTNLILVFVLGMSLYVARGIVGSLALLVDGARAVGQGRFDEPIAFRTGDEIEDVARSLDEARLSLKEREAFSNALNTINATISSTLNVNEIMEKVVVEAAQAIGAEAGYVMVREHDHWTMRYTYRMPPQGQPGTRFTDLEARVAVLAEESRKPVVISNALDDDRVNPDVMKRLGIRSMLAVPLRTKGGIMGTLGFTYHTVPMGFSDLQVDFAEKLTVALSLAMENARLYENERDIADTLQESLMIMPERVEGIEFGYLYRSAAETAKVGGDFFDVFELDRGKVGFIIGDISGKGIEAATLTSIVKNTIKAHAIEGGAPECVIAKTNELLVRTSSASIFVTVIFGMLDRGTGEVAYCCAGHPPAIIKRLAGEIEFLTEQSPIIGAFNHLQYTGGTTALNKGDILLLYTDGIIESRVQGDLFGDQRLAELLQSLETASAGELPQLVFDEVQRRTDGALSDDMAMLAISLTE